MTGTNYVDKTYLALELTKIVYSDRQSCTSEGIYGTFNYFLKELTNIDNLGIIEDYKNEIEDYKNEIENLRKQNKLLSSENQKLKSSCKSSFKTRIDLIKEYVNVNGGNMEPEVKKQLLKLLDTIFD